MNDFNAVIIRMVLPSQHKRTLNMDLHGEEEPMDRFSNQLMRQFHRKGLRKADFPLVINDIEHLKKENGDLTLHLLNRDLEDLGWGIDIVNREMFGMLSLPEDPNAQCGHIEDLVA